MNYFLGQHKQLSLLALVAGVTLLTAPATATHQLENRFLDTFRAVSEQDDDWNCGDWLEGTPAVAGETIAHSVYYDDFCDPDSRSGMKAVAAYDLGRDWQTFKSKIGLRDTSSEDARVLFEVYRDGQLALSHTMAFGQVHEIEVDVTGTLRVRLELTALEDDVDNDNYEAIAVWGSAELSRPKAHEYSRTVSLSLRKHLRAVGQVVVPDDFAACKSSVTLAIQRKRNSYSDWKEVGIATSTKGGSFRLSISDRVGKYRAVIEKAELGTNWPEHVFPKATSSLVRHRH